ncbi:13039_t:CDS:2 [Entrophospora sp. SA101]|nr:13039_t:CDS:2 [Entrophospora sp. SA101]
MESDLNSLRGLVEELRTENDILKKSLIQCHLNIMALAKGLVARDLRI